MKFLFGIVSLLFASISFAQIQGNGGLPKGFKTAQNEKNIDHRIFSTPDLEALREEDSRVDGTGTAPWRFGFNNYVQLNLDNSGTWTTVANGKIWKLKLTCEEAQTVNLTFRNTKIPNGNELYVYNLAKDFILGKFEANHLYNGVLGTELVPGATVIVEYFIPNGNPTGMVEVATVTHGYRSGKEFLVKAFGTSGSCNMNVNCPDGIPWALERNGAIMLVSNGNGFCSGSLINNTNNDGKPYVLTANHCYSDPTSWVFRFNWQAPDCTNPASSPSFQSLSGAVLRARRTPSDFCLVEITGGLENNTVPLSFIPRFNGWNRSNNPPSSTVSIHHPDGDIKKISFDDQAASAVQAMNSTEAESSWKVVWDRSTTTEGGSSGSPLFDQNHRIIGQLWGGTASCNNLTAPDYYGRLHNSWNPDGSTQSNQLKFWLDPTDTGAEFIDAYDPLNSSSIVYDAGISSPSGVAGTFCDAPVTPSFFLQNNGADTLFSALITYGYDGNLNQTFNWTGVLPRWQSTAVSLPSATLGAGNHTFGAVVSLPNGQADENNFNNSVSASFSVVIDGREVNLDLFFDCYGSETSWELQNEGGNAVYWGNGYSDDTEGLVSIPWCLNEGCYKFVIMDEYGDGLEGGFLCNVDGSVAIVYNGQTLAQIPESEANFGTQKELTFCIGPLGIEENSAVNFQLFPNPTDELVTISTSWSGLKTISLTNIEGREVLRQETSGFTTQLNCSPFAAGTYFVTVNANGLNAIQKLVIR